MDDQQRPAPDDVRRQLSDGMREQLELGRVFGGLATFGQRPFVPEVDRLQAWRPDVAIVGAPFDNSTTNRAGARFGPRAIRSLVYEPGSYHLDLGIEIFDWLEVVDHGDAHCPHGQTERSHANIHDRVLGVAERGIVPVVLGGDHSITWPAATAVAEVHGFGEVGMVHFDAHADTADTVDGNLASHGTLMRRLIESGAIPGTHFVQVGLRGYWPPEETFRWMIDQGMRWHTMQEIWERGFKAVMAEAVAEALASAELLYVSVDIDVLDPAHAPGTGTPEPGGDGHRRPAPNGAPALPPAPGGRSRRGRGVAALRRQRPHRQRRPPGGVRDIGGAGRPAAPRRRGRAGAAGPLDAPVASGPRPVRSGGGRDG